MDENIQDLANEIAKAGISYESDPNLREIARLQKRVHELELDVASREPDARPSRADIIDTIAKQQARIGELEHEVARRTIAHRMYTRDVVSLIDSQSARIAELESQLARLQPNRFRKKPVVIEARRWEDTEACREEMARWFSDHDYLFMTRGPVVEIDTLEGKMTASVGDWIICGVKGEFYPCKPDIFAATYDAVKS